MHRMKTTDCLFNDFLDYLTKYRLGTEFNMEQYLSAKPYDALWQRGHMMIQEGVCPAAIEVALEYEKIKLIMKGSLNEDELFTIILMEKLMCSLYAGDYFQIAVIVQNFASQEIQSKYAFLLEQLCNPPEVDMAMDEEYFDKQSVTFVQERSGEVMEHSDRNNVFEDLFISLQVCMRNSLAYQKIELIMKMIEQNISPQQIKRITSIDDVYLHIVENGVEQGNDILEIYSNLVFEGCILRKTDRPVNYRNLDFNEANMYQIVLKYWNRM